MAGQVLLYLPHAEDARTALRPVLGRPLGFRVLAAAVRAGARRVGVPAILRGTPIEAAIAASPAARRVVRWLSPGEPPWTGPVVLLPATVLLPTRAVEAMLTETPPAVLHAPDGRGAPVIALEGEGLRAAWAALVAGTAAGAYLDPLAERARARPEEADTGGIRLGAATPLGEAEALLYGCLGNPAVDTALDRALHRPLSRLVTRAAIATGITANQLTLASLAVGLAGAWLVGRATPPAALAGVLLYFLAVVLDHADGEVARLTLAESRLGHWLDLLADTAVHTALVIAIARSAPWDGHGTAALVGGAAAGGVVASALAAALLPIGRPEGTAGAGLARVLGDLGNRNGYYAMLLAFGCLLVAAPDRLRALTVVVAVGTNTYWVARLLAVRPWRAGARRLPRRAAS